MKHSFVRFISMFLAFAISLSGFPVTAAAPATLPEEEFDLSLEDEPAVTEEIVTEESMPEESSPEENASEESSPEENSSEESAPGEREPSITPPAASPTGFQPFTCIEVPEGSLGEAAYGIGVEAPMEPQSICYEDPYWDQFSTHYFYNQFNEKEKQLYDGLDSACRRVLNGNEDLSFYEGYYLAPAVSYKGLDKNRAADICLIFYYEHPQYYFLLGTVFITSSLIRFGCYENFHLGPVRAEATAAMRAQLDSWISEVSAETTDLDKERAAHDLIIRQVKYENTELDQSAYSAVVQKKSICMGYSYAMSMLLNAMGLDAGLVVSEDHAWNFVKMNGSWYYVDVTNDDYQDPDGPGGYALFNRSQAFLDSIADCFVPLSMLDGLLPTFDHDSGGSVEGTPSSAGQAAAPGILQTKSGSSSRITLTDQAGDAALWYTLDGSEPGSCCSKSTKYTGPFKAKNGVTIKVVAEKDEYLDSDTVTVIAGKNEELVSVTGVTIEPAGLSLKTGEIGLVTASVLPENASDRRIIWESSDPSVVFVSDSGRVLAGIGGTAMVSARTRDGGFIARCTVTVAGTETPENMKLWSAAEAMGDSLVNVRLVHTAATTYDGRKHVVGTVGTKTVTETAGVSPDLALQDFGVYVDGEPLSGVTISSVSYKNNTLPSGDGVSNQAMYMNLKLKFDGKDAELKSWLKTLPKLKSVLNQMVKPVYNKKKGVWNYDPITVEIGRIALDENTEVYTAAELKSDPSLKTRDGILVWNGMDSRKKNVNIKTDSKTGYITSAEYKGLYYQRVFRLPNGKTVVKKLTLKPGAWKVMGSDQKQDGKKVWTYFGMLMKTSGCDYFPAKETLYQDGETPSILLNGDDTDWTGNTSAIKRGRFTGTLPPLQK